MLSKAPAAATMPAVDLKRAKDFYTKKLGLKMVKEDPGPGALFEAGKGTMIYLYQRGPSKADHTEVSFEVENVEAEVKELRAKGVKFEEYNMPDMGLKTVNGIAAMDGHKMAWFKDTEGNILGITSM